MVTAASDLTGLAHVADVLNHLVLPFFVLTVAYLAEYSLIMRSSLIDVLGDDFILTARAKGVRDEGAVAARRAERAPADDDRDDPLARLRLRWRHHRRDVFS